MNAVTIAPFAFAKSSGTSVADFTSFEANVATTVSMPTAMASKSIQNQTCVVRSFNYSTPPRNA